MMPKLTNYEPQGRSENSNDCLINHKPFIVKQQQQKHTCINFNISLINAMKTILQHGMLQVPGAHQSQHDVAKTPIIASIFFVIFVNNIYAFPLSLRPFDIRFNKEN